MMAADLSETKRKKFHFNARFDNIEKSKEELVKKQESGFYKLEFLLNSLIGQLTPNTINQTPHNCQVETLFNNPVINQAISPTRKKPQTLLGHYTISPMFASTPSWNEDIENEDFQDA